MKKPLLILVFVLLLLGAGFAFWYFNRKARQVIKEDPYQALRSETGRYAPGEWKGAEKQQYGDGYWVVLGQDFPEHDRSKLHGTAQAFIKGYDIMPTAAQFRALLQDDLSAFIAQHGYLSPLEVMQGEFLPA